jgi:hypothetical protein
MWLKKKKHFQDQIRPSKQFSILYGKDSSYLRWKDAV